MTYNTASQGQAVDRAYSNKVAAPETAAQAALHAHESVVSSLRELKSRVEVLADHLGCNTPDKERDNVPHAIRSGVIGSIHATAETAQEILASVLQTLSRIEGQI